MSPEEKDELTYDALAGSKNLSLDQLVSATGFPKERVRLTMRRYEEAGLVKRTYGFNNKVSFRQTTSPKQLMSRKWTPEDLVIPLATEE
jgi:DeoR/GlpR family transcriptional regulator of sugar metabolism